MQQSFEYDRLRGAWKRQLARGHLVEHHTEREEVGPQIERLAARLLRGHVGDRANRRTRRSQLPRGRFHRYFGETEIQYLDLCDTALRFRNEKVAGFDVAV